MSTVIAVTGTGAICSAGTTPEQIYRTLCAGQTAFAPLGQWDSSSWPAPLAGGVESLDPAAIFEDRKLLKALQRLHRTDLLGLLAASRAVQAARIVEYRRAFDEPEQQIFNERTAVHTGGGGVAYHYQYDFLPALAASGGELHAFGEKLGATVNPTWLLQALPNNVLCYLGIAYGFKGPNSCITNHSVSGMMAIIEAFHTLRAGEADRAVAVGHDSPIEPEAILNLYRLGLVTTDLIRPFDNARSGCLLGEGAAALTLEAPAATQARGAHVIGTILGGGVTTEASGVLGIRADGNGEAHAIELALDDAGISPGDVGLIAAHGNGTVNSDQSEAAALSGIFGSDMPPVTAFKWAFGHTMAAAGALDTVIALSCLRAGYAPGIATLREIDPRCRPLPVSSVGARPRSDIALVLSRGFGGMSAALVIKASAGDGS
ncbi:MAG: beta-ketoacyl-[acyl-carrier-protein] synthase family protein [Candidatus Binataceae bacterium]